MRAYGWLVSKDAPKETLDFMKVWLGKETQTKLAAKGLSIPMVKSRVTEYMDGDDYVHMDIEHLTPDHQKTSQRVTVKEYREFWDRVKDFVLPGSPNPGRVAPALARLQSELVKMM